MAIPAAPTTVFLQTGNQSVLVTWNQVPTATSYSVQRSTDNITFATLATPSTYSYLDSAVTLGTQYYYQVAATNISGTSAYTTPTTAPFSIVPTLPGKVSLGELRLRSQQMADRVNSNFVTIPEWNYFINQSYYELYDLLITVQEDYYVAPRLTFSTDGVSYLYALPDGALYSGAPALYKLFGADIGLDNTTNAWVTLKKFEFIQRNRYVYPQVTSTFLGVFNLQYRLVGGNIMFIPTPSANQVLGLWYFPRLTTLLQDTDVMDGISGWEEFVIVCSAIYALDKEESSTVVLSARKADLVARINGSAMNRDSGAPDMISDITWNNRHGGMAGGWGYDGTSGGI